jgi:hypothetical protein
VAHFRVMASEVGSVWGEFPRDFPRNFTLRATVNESIHVPLPEGGLQPKMFPPGYTIRRALASRTTTPATVTNHLVRCSRSVIISPYVVSRASLLGRRTYLNARYSTSPLLIVFVTDPSASISPYVGFLPELNFQSYCHAYWSVVPLQCAASAGC